jgi:hypothetical protein
VASATPSILAAVSTTGWTISIIGILIAVVIAFNVFGGKQDLERVRRRMRRNAP